MISIKTLIYCNNQKISDDLFFEKMENLSEVGCDVIIFGEGVYTPYTELLSGMDVLDGEDYNYVLESLYGFCFEFGSAAVFNGIDAYGMHFSIFVNPFAQNRETYNKLYIKHASDKGSVFELEDYKDCIGEIFQPINFKGEKIGLIMGSDIFLSKIFAKYRLNGVTCILGCACDTDQKYLSRAKDICVGNNMVINVAVSGEDFVFETPLGTNNIQKIDDNIYTSDFSKRDFAKKCGLIQNDFSNDYLTKEQQEIYKIL